MYAKSIASLVPGHEGDQQTPPNLPTNHPTYQRPATAQTPSSTDIAISDSARRGGDAAFVFKFGCELEPRGQVRRPHLQRDEGPAKDHTQTAT